MVVDDNQVAANLMGEILEAVGHIVMIECDPTIALERAFFERPDVCLLDIGLSGMDGNEMAERLRADPATSKAVLVAITGYGQKEDCKKSLERGFDHHLVKPVDHVQLSKILNYIAVRMKN